MKKVYLYYFILLLLLAFNVNQGYPPVFVRILFLILVFAPSILKYKQLFPICIISFYTIGVNGFSYGFMPYSLEIYVVFALIGLIINTYKIPERVVNFCIFLFFFAFFIFLRDILDSFSIYNIFSSILLTLLCILFFKPNNKDNIVLFLFIFSLMSLLISSVYFLNYDRFVSAYGYGSSLERSGWTDPNYLSCVVGMGVVSSLILLFYNNNQNIVKVYLILTICISFVAQVLLASRGGVLSTLLASICLLIFSNIKIKYKCIFLLLSIIFIVLMYTNNLFMLLQYRIENDDKGGSGRLDIWTRKLDIYLQSDIIHLIFGYGRDSGTLMGFSYNKGYHNDFIAFLCSYGILGFSMFLYLLYFPIKRVLDPNRIIVISLILYIITCSCTLEPFTLGNFTYYGFYLLILMISLYPMKFYN